MSDIDVKALRNPPTHDIEPRHVVLQHTHHKDEGVYRIVIGVVQDHPLPVQVPNPDFNPEHPEHLVYDNLGPEHRYALVFGELPKLKDYHPATAKVDENGLTKHTKPRFKLNKADQAKIDAIPTTGINSPTIMQERLVPHLIGQHDIVFAADDERWAGMQPDKIAAEQRKIVRQQLEKNVAEARKAAQQKQRATADLGGAGEEL